MPSDILKTADQLRSALSAGENWTFKSLHVVDEGDYHADDADWNYKDIPHARYVHGTIEGYISYVSDGMMTAINRQSFGPFSFPLTMVLYASRPNRQTYHTTFGPFVIIVESRWETIAENRTRVQTTYQVGGSRLLVNISWPFWKRVLRENYAALMKDDLPMRRRRGALRKRGYSFRREGKDTYSYVSTLEVMSDHVVIPPASAPADLRIAIDDLPDRVTVRLGDDAAYGVQLLRSGDVVNVFPRLCPHEGACLDGQNGNEGRVQCPWHGRFFPATILPLSEGAEATCGRMRVRVSGGHVVAMAEALAPSSA